MPKSRINFTVVLFLLISFSYSAQAQSEWAPIGAKWSYQLYNMWNYIFTFTTFTSLKDTLVSNKIYKKIEINALVNDSTNHKKTSSKDYLLMYGENGKVYYSYKDTFLLLYDFSLKAGDTLVIPKLYSDGFKDSLKTKYVIESVSNINISGKILKKQEIRLILDSVNGSDPHHYFCSRYQSGYIIENIGSEYYMFGENFMLEEIFSKLKCYNDSELSYKISPGSNCDAFDGIVETNTFTVLNLYPNPTFDHLTIDCKSSSKEIDFEIINYFGQTILKSTFLHRTVIDLSNFSKGLYFLKLKAGDSFLLRKFVKE